MKTKHLTPVQKLNLAAELRREAIEELQRTGTPERVVKLMAGES